MAWRPSDWVIEGELDNTTQGWTTGWILIGQPDDPIKLSLKLAGNCHPDLAGWKFKIVRIDPRPDWAEPLSCLDSFSTNQSGHVGDITADQTLKHFECSTEEFIRRSNLGEPPPTTWRKALYLEWFSHTNGRIVIQSTSLTVERQGERAFQLSDQQWEAQQKQNAEEINFFMTQLGDALENDTPDSDHPETEDGDSQD